MPPLYVRMRDSEQLQSTDDSSYDVSLRSVCSLARTEIKRHFKKLLGAAFCFAPTTKEQCQYYNTVTATAVHWPKHTLELNTNDNISHKNSVQLEANSRLFTITTRDLTHRINPWGSDSSLIQPSGCVVPWLDFVFYALNLVSQRIRAISTFWLLLLGGNEKNKGLKAGSGRRSEFRCCHVMFSCFCMWWTEFLDSQLTKTHGFMLT